MRDNVNTVIANNVKTYRETAGYSQEVLAHKAYMPLDILQKVEKGLYFDNKFFYIMKIAETFWLAYYDLFERPDGSVARNLFVPQEAINKIFAMLEKKGVTNDTFCKAIGTKRNSIWYWKNGKCVPSPLLFHNAVTYLGLHADSFKDIKTKEKPKEITKAADTPAEIKKEECKQPSGLAEVIKACNVYQKLDSVINQLDAIIKTATDLKAELEKERE